jgi:hypothetical protein
VAAVVSSHINSAPLVTASEGRLPAVITDGTRRRAVIVCFTLVFPEDVTIKYKVFTEEIRGTSHLVGMIALKDVVSEDVKSESCRSQGPQSR